MAGLCEIGMRGQVFTMSCFSLEQIHSSRPYHVTELSRMEEPNLPASLSEFAVTSLPDTAYYVPNFITQAEEQIFLDKVLALKPMLFSSY